MIRELTILDIDIIIEHEKKAFITEMQATRETYISRFEKGHISLGYFSSGELSGIISFYYGLYDPGKPESIPNTFSNWSSPCMSKKYDTVFIYNLGFVRSGRGTGAIKKLIHTAFEKAYTDGCYQALGEGPVPSYAGNTHVRSNLEIRRNLDHYTNEGVAPSDELLFRDPHLFLYRRITGCSVVRIIPSFIPCDTASGGFRVILFRNLYDYFGEKFTLRTVGLRA